MPSEASMSHQPVLLKEIIEGLALRGGETVVDATVNRGGHARALCEIIGPRGRLIGLDKDRTALAEAEENLRGCPCRIELILGGFEGLADILAERGVEKINGCLMDLGMSSEQLERSGRGFSFQSNDPLLMTFDDKPAAEALTAAEIVNSWPEEEIRRLLTEFGEERFAPQIAKAIVLRRKSGSILTCQQLVEVIGEAVPLWYKKRRLHFATRTFQALRMAVNDELNVLSRGLAGIWRNLRSGGRLAVITFHSLEARLVKDFFKKKQTEQGDRIITKHAIKPERSEILRNPRARSAQLRIIQKT